jgi:hypothetical protein
LSSASPPVERRVKWVSIAVDGNCWMTRRIGVACITGIQGVRHERNAVPLREAEENEKTYRTMVHLKCGVQRLSAVKPFDKRAT